jgi:hypothetical protein
MPKDVRQIAVTHVQDGVAVGGSLVVCSDRLVFAPNMLERGLQPIWDMLGNIDERLRLSKAKAVEITFAEIDSVGKQDGELKLKELLGGGIWDRIAVNLKEGEPELFVCAFKTDESIEYLNGCIKGD